MADNAQPIDTEAACCAAIRGERVPSDLSTDVMRASLVRGIRLHYAFATSNRMSELAASDAQFTRARNARLIMSNEVPAVMAPSEQPYCIWYPDFATEETYRSLAQRHPQMRYQVGRACAAAGYHALYRELDLLPDVSIAEEARESGTEGGRLIYESIMRQPCRHAVMDDYSLRIETENPRSPVFLNGDTEVRWRLEYRVGAPSRPDYRKPCIEEDMHCHDERTRWSAEHNNLTRDEAKLLYTPLPRDLPTVKKRLLIQMAAFEGNVDRYARLAPGKWTMDKLELICVIRGIYHHTMFARWWAEEIAQNTPRAQAVAAIDGRHLSYLDKIKMAISARRIMLNDPREFFDDGWPARAPQPYLIWWPLRPDRNMLQMLVEKVPEMAEQVAVAAVFCNYEDIYKSLKPTPHWNLWMAASQASNPFYRQDLETRAAEQGIDVTSGSPQDSDAYGLDADLEPTRIFDFPDVDDYEPIYDGIDERSGPYNDGSGADTGETEFRIWAGLAKAR
jgi:hypothetical protein